MGEARNPRRVNCDACGREFNKVYWETKPHLCPSCQRLGRDACTRCEGWCCERPNEFGRITVLDHEMERFGLKSNLMWGMPCHYRDPESGYCMLQKRFRLTICREYVCDAMVNSARAKLAGDQGQILVKDPEISDEGDGTVFRPTSIKVALQAGLLFYKARFPKLTDDELFVLWFLQLCFADDEEAAASAILGGHNDRGIDAVYIDDKVGVVFLVHGKFRQSAGRRRKEQRGDVLPFAGLGLELWGDKASFNELLTDLDSPDRAKLEAARERLVERNYSLHLYYATLGGFAPGLIEEVSRLKRKAVGRTEILLLDNRKVFTILADSLDCFAPPPKSPILAENAEEEGQPLGALIANDSKQVLIERELRKVGYQYLRKGQAKWEVKRASSALYRFLVKKEELARAVAACKFDPVVVKGGNKVLFDKRYYSSIFGSADANYYLSRFWLMKRVVLAARGYPQRGQAKWVVLHFMWENAGRDIQRNARRFREACEKPGYGDNKLIVSSLDDAIDSAYTAVLQFCRENLRDFGPGAKDVSAFFMQKGLHKKFGSFWQTEAGKQRKQFHKSIERFASALRG